MASKMRGFTLLETLIALSLVSFSMTGLVVALGSGAKYGALARRQATAMTVARSQVEALAHATYNPPALGLDTTSNTLNDTDGLFADPVGAFAGATIPTGNGAPDATLPSVFVGQDVARQIQGEKYDVYVNVRPMADPSTGSEMGKQIAVIVRYKIGAQWMRAVALGYRYNPQAVGVADNLPL
ncbi:MAG: prepilin-type N-terminal cleavage/methylation domain-containing protein [Myxococcales bacterium]